MKAITLQRVSVTSILLALFLITSSFSFTKIEWDHLGSRTVNYRLDKDVIHVTAKKGGFKKLKIKVTNGAINMHKMVIEYGNGKKDIIQLRHNFSRRSTSKTIDLKGNKRVIKDITFFYDTKNLSRKRAKVHVFGKH
ncbi:hypothetical protein AWE51_02295 [Aquimarina aggregata]|uniref:DUF2541 domain-containing protein n=1 Tax=Aquimarina aggregata TaxID=1642818 RepID=A0A163CDB8_9FLAO|nr:DUF2541 family protein [Aquimarina aggregata]KZS42291.1 hypothetical protein AWE51_02295 [Aquimarina aggregata]